jgi:hypothetical protein
MPAMARFYRRTEAGRRAWDTQAAGVPLEHRRVLGVVIDDIEPKDVCDKLGWSEMELEEILAELERAKMVERIETDDTDLDFTGAFSLAQLGTRKSA